MKKRREILLVIVAVVFCVLISFTVYAKNNNKNEKVNISEKTVKKIEKCEIYKKEKADKNQIKKVAVNSTMGSKTKSESESFYIKSIKMPKEHQKYLYNLCKKRGLDYLKVLAIISLESNFNSKLVNNSGDYGYMQINKVNHKYLSETLGTENAPLDPYVNLNWGTYMLSNLYKQWRAEKIDDTVKKGEIFSTLDKYVISSYNKGVAGFKKGGMASRYIGLARRRYMQIVNSIMLFKQKK